MVTSQETTPREERREKRVRFVLPDRTRSREREQRGHDYRESRYSHSRDDSERRRSRSPGRGYREVRYSHRDRRERSSLRYSRSRSRDDERRRRSRSPSYDSPRRHYRGSRRRSNSPDDGRERSDRRNQRRPRRHDSNRSREYREDRTRTRDHGKPSNQQSSTLGGPEATGDGPRRRNGNLFPVHSIPSVVDEIQRTIPGPQVDMVWGPRPVIRAMYEEFKAKNGLFTAHILPSRDDDEGDGNAY
ncbi:hypothetical protein NW752_003082 [Fusarium irregulare]|uniref:Uncharacterized protein n=1 Tax=Fusarium irregulare TaxID=2494466 RepID=A0A9W8Q1I0_9HYPO|nr:hypothetical protein NW766_000751 [Fusarium irregulare]KAJ4025609.1 hypothetical protein NW752_003082 [Fusarium irregulare]